MKKIFKMIIINTLLIMILCPMIVKADSLTTPVIHYIFDNTTVKKDEEFTVMLLLEKYQDLSTVQFVCKVDFDKFMPVQKSNKYFIKPSLSLFSDTEIYENTFLADENLLRFVGITKGGKTYGYSSLNQVFQISFKANSDLENVPKYFQSQDNCSTILIDKWARQITCEERYTESLKTTWGVEKYTVDVFNELPDITKDIQVLNRKVNVYQLEVVKSELDLSKIGLQVVKVKIYDYLTTEIIYLAKTIEVVDKISPIISIPANEIRIDDQEILDNDFAYFQVSDNYDLNPQLHYKYYNNSNQELSGLEAFKDYLLKNNLGYITCYGEDSSNNKSKEEVIAIRIKDTTPPTITSLKDLVINDQQLEQFDFSSLIQMSDNYDPQPRLVYIIYDAQGKVYDDYHKALNDIYEITIEYYAIDQSGNQSEKQKIQVQLLDTTPPVLSNVLDIEIPDELLKNYLDNHQLLTKDFIITDNFTKELTLHKVYYYQEEIITEEEFFNNLKQGLPGKVTYQVSDSCENYSDMHTQLIMVKDDTPPTIIVNNLKNNQKYLGPLKIDYQVIDNIEGILNVVVWLNDQKYENQEISDLGQYIFKIDASDQFGNQETCEIQFEIVEENLFGCIDGMNCEENNYAVGIIIGIVIVLIVTTVVTFEIIYIKKKKNRPQE